MVKDGCLGATRLVTLLKLPGVPLLVVDQTWCIVAFVEILENG
jgi:hypothetical protein